MKKTGFINSHLILAGILLSLIYLSTNCKKAANPIKYKLGTFPDSVINVSDINSAYDDYNIGLSELSDNFTIIFSSNRKSAGGQFDLEQGNISYTFNQTSGAFGFGSTLTSDPFLVKLINKATTAKNDFGPYRMFSTDDGNEYLILSSQNESGNLDFFYLKNTPVSGNLTPDITGPLPLKLINTASDDGYLCFNLKQDTAYFCSDKDGNFDIFYLKKPANKDLSTWFNSDYTLPVKLDSINSSSDDKCPFILKKTMVFTSNRPGGYGGFDLYYSIMKNGKWSSPVNMGPRINTSYDEYRPVLGLNQDFTNNYLMFSSNRPGGKGGFDLYFTGSGILAR